MKELNLIMKRLEWYRRWRSLTYPLRAFRRGIVSLWRWFPIIWNDCQFDHCYFYTMMIYKLELMEKFFLSDQVHIMHPERYARQIRVCRVTLQRLQDGEIRIEDEAKYKKFVFRIMGKYVDYWWD